MILTDWHLNLDGEHNLCVGSKGGGVNQYDHDLVPE